MTARKDVVERDGARVLRTIKVVHTVIWAFFASCVVAIPFCAWTGRTGAALVLIGTVFLEVLVLVFNRWKCPLTDVAERYTDDRGGNFDIYLPAWLGRNNKLVFGLLYALGVVITVVRWAA